MLLDIALDFVLDQVGENSVEHRAEYEMLHAGRSRRVHRGEPKLSFLGVEGRPDVIDFFDPIHGAGEDSGIGDISDHDVDHTLGAKSVRGCIRANARTQRCACG